MVYPAHIRVEEKADGTSGQFVQSVEEHCKNCAVYASSAAPPGIKQTAYLAGLLHDMGKFTEAFTRYITLAAAGGPARRGSVNHTFAGARFALERWHNSAQPTCQSMTAELLAFAVAAHHGQFDCIAPDGTDGFLHRLTTEGTGYAQAREQFLVHCADTQALDCLFDAATSEVAAALERCRPFAENAEELLFYFALLARQLLSAVIEGDRRDTAEFMHALPFSAREADTQADWRGLLARVEARLSALPADTDINVARRRISDICRAAANGASGIFRLTVPTGGGKTLAALRYSLAAAMQGKKRIFFVIPLLSVLEQNAAVLRDYLGENGKADRLILEHHSNVVREKPDDGELDENELLLNNWRAPVVITTLVQLLNTLLSGKPSCVRRMGALCDSVMIIDEVQSVPRNMLSEWNLALNFLSEFCGATVVLCSATQPCLEKTTHRLRYATAPELVPYDAALWSAFRRTALLDFRRPQGHTAEELSDFALSCAAEQRSLLFICNTKSEARTLFKSIHEKWDGLLFHLSTGMCMAHRIKTLSAINAALQSRARVICVSTQLVEAGVDFSFGCVIRVLAGMDNAVQAAGRCNRGGEFGRLCPVYLVNIRGENLSHLPEIRQSQQAAEALLLQFQRAPKAFMEDLTGEAAIRAYYRSLYAEMKKGSQDYPLPKLGTTLLALLSTNAPSRAHCKTAAEYTLGQAFRTAGEQFHVFDDNTCDVLVPYGEGNELIASLGSQRAAYDLAGRAALLQKTSQFCVSLYEYELKRLREAGGIYSLCEDTLLVLQPDFYTDKIGFSASGNADFFMEV
ncbi:MAG: CRISPR-associated helicase Cas3' [Ruthenibacterium sp.]